MKKIIFCEKLVTRFSQQKKEDGYSLNKVRIMIIWAKTIRSPKTHKLFSSELVNNNWKAEAAHKKKCANIPDNIEKLDF